MVSDKYYERFFLYHIFQNLEIVLCVIDSSCASDHHRTKLIEYANLINPTKKKTIFISPRGD